MDDMNWYENDEGFELSVYQDELKILQIEMDDVEKCFILTNNLDKSSLFMMADNIEDAKDEAIEWLREYCDNEIDFMNDIREKIKIDAKQ